MKRSISKLLLAAVAVILSASLSVVAQGATSQVISLVAGKAETIALPQPAADILVANPGIADVGSLRADRLYVVGRGVGDTNILAFDDKGQQIADIAVHVSVDDDTLRKTLKDLFPKERIEVRTVNNNVILKGTVSTPVVANQVRDLATRFIGAAATNRTLVDLMTVRGEQQVMLKVKVLEVRRDVLREMGINLDLAGALGHPSHVTGGLTTTPGFGLSATQFGSGVLSLAQRGNFGPIDLDIDGLETQGLISTLAEPTLTAISGETAGFLAGGEFPVPAGRDTSGNVSLEFRQFGVSLNFIPTVLGEERISLQLTSEVSERSDSDGVTLLGTLIPGLSVRRAQTTVQMGSGGTIMIAGLLRSRTTQGLNGLPGFKDLPILGELFKSKSFQRGESELVFLVTPYLVEPFADQQAERVTRNDDDVLHSLLETGKDGVMPVTAPANMPGKLGPKPQPLQQRLDLPVPHKTRYPRQGEESRTAGDKKADATDSIWRAQGSQVTKTAAAPLAPPSGLVGAPVVDADPALVMSPDHPALMLPVAGKGKLSLNDVTLPDDVIPLPRRKPVMGDSHRLAALPAAAPVEDVKIASLPALEPAAGKLSPVKKPLLQVATRAVGIPLPRHKPVTAEQTQALSSSFMNNLKKIYGTHVSAKLGEGHSYGYIVD